MLRGGRARGTGKARLGGMLVTFDVAPPVGERYAPDAFASRVGQATMFAAPYMLEVPATRGVLAKAFVEPGGCRAELTADIPDDSPVAAEISRQGGGGPGPFRVYDDGVIGVPFEIRRRDPAEAARLIRERYREHGWPEDLAEAMIEETLKP